MRDDLRMRTTLDLDDDILQAAKELAAVRGVSAGKVLSDLARQALEPTPREPLRSGVPLLPPRPPNSPKLTMKMVNGLRDDG